MLARIRQSRHPSTKAQRFSSTLFHKPLWTRKRDNVKTRINKPTATETVLEIVTENRGTPEDGKTSRSAFIIEPFDKLSKQSHIVQSHEIPLEKLYGIPQATWDEFLSHLPNKEVLEILNISYYRHNWRSYNFCVTPRNYEKHPFYVYPFEEDNSNELMRKRAILISNNHYLLPILELKRYASYLLDSKQWNAGERTLCHHETQQYVVEMRTKIYHADFNPNHLRQICPYYTKSFLKKMSNCDNDKVWETWIRFIDEYAYVKTVDSSGNLTENLDTKRMMDAIDWIPSSRTEPAEFYHAAELAQELLKISLPILPYPTYRNGLLGGLFFNSKQQWPSHEIRQFQENNALLHCFDYLHALFHDLVLRILLQHLNQAHYDTDQPMIHELRKQFFRVLTERLSLDQLSKLQTRWHRNLHIIADQKPLLAADGLTWKPIIPETTINDVTIRALTSERALKEHAKVMKHCVNGYVTPALRNHCDILELTNAEGISTLDCRHDNKEGVFTISQHAGIENVQAPPSHTQAAKELMIHLNERTIAINHERLNDPGVYELPFPYDVHDLITQEKIYAAYRSTQCLPQKLHAEDYAGMLKKTGLETLVKEHFVASIPKDDEESARKAIASTQ